MERQDESLQAKAAVIAEGCIAVRLRLLTRAVTRIYNQNRLSTHGRRIYLIKMFMDEVSFEGGGSVVRMRKKSNAGAVAQRRERNDA
jgi:hypothetical protein